MGAESSRSAQGDPVAEAAAAWLVRRDAGPLGEAEQAAFETWLAADCRHAAAYWRLAALWHELDDLPAPAPAEADPPPRPSPRRPRWRSIAAPGLAVAATLLLAAIVLKLPLHWQADVMTAVGERETATLPDGSTVTLNTATALAYDFGPDERGVRLLRGEAVFDVAPDHARPFRVRAAGGVATAAGTRFNVRRRPDGAEVTVIEGRVRVAYPAEAQSASALSLEPDRQVRYTAADGLGRVQPVDARQVIAWERGKLMFVDRPLEEVIEELDRYYRGRIFLTGAVLRERRVNGVFGIDEPGAALAALERSLGISTTRLTDYLILIHR